MIKKPFVQSLKFYKKHISPYFIKSCRFYPSCSEYAQESIETYGICRGGIKALWRLLRCNPFSKGGYDPIK